MADLPLHWDYLKILPDTVQNNQINYLVSYAVVLQRDFRLRIVVAFLAA